MLPNINQKRVEVNELGEVLLRIHLISLDIILFIVAFW